MIKKIRYIGLDCGTMKHGDIRTVTEETELYYQYTDNKDSIGVRPKNDFEVVTEIAEDLPPGTKAKKLSNKAHLAYFDPYLEHEMGMGMRYGAEKHGWNNHRNLSVEASQQILDSLKRHLNDFLRQGPVDEESQTSHLACLINNANFLYRLVRIHGYDAVMDVIYGKETR